MVVRVHNITKWERLKAGSMIGIAGFAPHRVRLELNTETRARVDLVEGAEGRESVTFLAVVEGLDAVVFTAAPGARVSVTSDGDVYYFTSEGDSHEVPWDQETFTRLADRPTRNPDLELMMFRADQNRLRLEQQVADSLARIDARMAQLREVQDGADRAGAVGSGAQGAAGAPAGAAEAPEAGAGDGGGA